jgi:hypothetical protein
LIELGPDERVAGRPFSAPDRTRKDGAVLRRMYARLRTHAATNVAAMGVGDRIDKITDPDASVHTIVLPDLGLMRRAGDLFGVGFFGQARRRVDHTPIMELEAALIADMPASEGLVAYYNAFYQDDGWGNLVLFADVVAERAWGGDPRHVEAVRRSAAHYHSIRLHHALAKGGLFGSGPIEIVRTRYIDFGDDPPWRAIREREVMSRG